MIIKSSTRIFNLPKKDYVKHTNIRSPYVISHIKFILRHNKNKFMMVILFNKLIYELND